MSIMGINKDKQRKTEMKKRVEAYLEENEQQNVENTISNKNNDNEIQLSK